MMTMGLTPSDGASGTRITAPAIVATLNIAGESAGMKKCCRAFNIAMKAAATAISGRNGNMMRVSRTVSSSLPGTLLNPPA